MLNKKSVNSRDHKDKSCSQHNAIYSNILDEVSLINRDANTKEWEQSHKVSG